MTADPPTRRFGRYVLGLGVIALGLVKLALSGSGPPAAELTGRAALSYAGSAVMIVAGAALLWRRTKTWGAAAVAAWFAIVVLGVTNLPGVVRHYREFLAWFGLTEPLAITAGALIAFAGGANIPAVTAQPLIRLSRIAFGACAVYFGVAHFAHMELTAPLVPKWLPPSQVFWGYATGVFHIAAGLALMSGVQARLAAILLTVMYAAFTPLVHIPLFLANQHDHRNWMENAMNIALAGAAWVVADSLARRKV
jgi:uncharacterized membrane protein YphA (DoxX/SURF4 family)